MDINNLQGNGTRGFDGLCLNMGTQEANMTILFTSRSSMMVLLSIYCSMWMMCL